MSQLNAAVAWLQTQRKQFMSVAGTYQQGATQIPNLLVTIGKTEFDIDDAQTMRIANEQIDLIIAASDMVANGQPVIPTQGDTWTFGTQIFEVRQLDSQSQPATTDPTGQQYRIHAHRIQ